MTPRNCTNTQKQLFAERLKYMRRAAGLSQQQIAHVLGINRSTYAYYELAKTLPNIFTLQKIAKAYGTSMEEILRECQPLKIVS